MKRRINLDRDLLESCAWLPLRISLRDLWVAGLYVAGLYAALQVMDPVTAAVFQALGI